MSSDLVIAIIALSLQTISFIVGGVWFVWKMNTALALLTSKYEEIANRLIKVDVNLDNLNKATIEVARQDVRLNHIEERIQEISNRVVRGLRAKSR